MIYTEENIKNLIKDIDELESLCSERAIEKMNATGKGFGKYNSFDSISYSSKLVVVTVIDRGYDLREEAQETLFIEEICMDEKKWKEHIETIKTTTQKLKEQQKIDAEKEEKIQRKAKYLALKKEFES